MLNKPHVMKKFLLLLWALTTLALQGQTLTERLLWVDTMGTYKIEPYSYTISFDRDGNYCFCVKKDGNQTAVASNAPIDGLCYAGGGYSKYGSSRFLRLCDSPNTDPLYVMNGDGTNIYGPVAGTVVGYRSGETRQHFANTSLRNDTAFFYLDGRLAYSAPQETIKKFKLKDENWVDFSNNGNAIYYLEQDERFVLYVNDHPVDTSELHFDALAINDKGDYLYAKLVKFDKPIGQYDYAYFIHTKDTVFDCVRTTWKYAMKGDGAYYCTGDDCGPDYLVLNGRMRNGIEDFSNITLLDSKNAFYTFEKDNHLYLNVNGNDYLVGFEELFKPSMDSNGHFAYYGLKDYYLYKVVDNVKVEEPLSKYGVRAMPLYISPQGSSVHYFKTDDSVYVYKDEELLFNPIRRTEKFMIYPWDEVLPKMWEYGKPSYGHSLFCMNYEDKGYFVYDGQFSEALLPLFKQYGDNPKPGGVVDGLFNDYGYFAILNTGEKEYQVVVNGRICAELFNVDSIFSEKSYFDGRHVTFYGMKNNAVYQFVVTL